MTQEEADAVRLQGIVCDSILTLFYPTFTMADADALIAQVEGGQTIAQITATIVAATGKSSGDVTPVVTQFMAGLP